MVLKIGYDNTESENKVYIRYNNLYYSEFLSRLLKENKKINRNLEIELSKINSAFGLKYQALIKNFFFFSVNKHIYSFEAEVSQRYKMSKLVNFEMSPHIKLICKNNKFPITLSLKYFNIQSSRSQVLLEGNDFSKVVKSLLPYDVTCLSVLHQNSKDFKLFDRNNLFIYKLKCSYGKIQNYEDFIKLSFGYKLLLDIPLPFDWFSLSLHIDNQLKKSFSFDNYVKKSNKENDEKFNIKSSHVLSNFDCYSKLLGVNILSREGIVDNGVNFYIHSNTSFRIKDIKFLRDYELLNRLEPYFGLEGVYRPTEDDSIKKRISLIYSCGLSLKLQDYLYIDFMLKSWSYNSHIDHDKVNRFRMGVEISTNI